VWKKLFESVWGRAVYALLGTLFVGCSYYLYSIRGGRESHFFLLMLAFELFLFQTVLFSCIPPFLRDTKRSDGKPFERKDRILAAIIMVLSVPVFWGLGWMTLQ
jgi:hypothetical protein